MKLSIILVEPEHTQLLLEAVNLDQQHLTGPQQDQLKKFILPNYEVFPLDPSELGTTDIVTHAVSTGDHSPIRQHPRKIPFALRNQVTKMVDEMLTYKVIQPSNSRWASPLVLVVKKVHSDFVRTVGT